MLDVVVMNMGNRGLSEWRIMGIADRNRQNEDQNFSKFLQDFGILDTSKWPEKSSMRLG